MGILLASQLKPHNAPCSWPDRCLFWRRRASDNLICPTPLMVVAGAGGFSITMAIAGDFLGATPVLGGCAGSSVYIDNGATGNAIRFDIWKALADGAWSSSASFTIYAWRFSSAAAGTLTGYAGRSTDTGLDPANVVFATSFPTGSGCPSVAVGTLTVYDDSTYTLT